MSLSVLRRTAAEIAAAAVYELFPHVQLLGGGETSLGFVYDFHFPHPINPDTVHQIEAQMKQIVREKRVIRTLEMVPLSARGLLKSQGHVERADEIEEGGLVEVVRIGTFHDLSPGPHLKNSAELAAFKICIEALPEKQMRIIGWAHSSKDELKFFLKNLDAYATQNHQYLGEKKGYWKGLIWLPEGMKIRASLIEFLKKQLFSHAIEVSTPIQEDRTTSHLSLKKGAVAEVGISFNEDFDPELGLLSPGQETTLQLTFCENPEEELISFLHSIGKTLTILGFSYSHVLMGRGHLFQRLAREAWGEKIDLQEAKGLQVDFLVEDGVNRYWSVFQFKMISAATFIVTASVERMIALLMEKNLVSRMVRS